MSAEEWWELLDEELGIYYYYNLNTEETVWERPKTGIITRPSEEEFEEQQPENEEQKEEKYEDCYKLELPQISPKPTIGDDIIISNSQTDNNDENEIMNDSQKVENDSNCSLNDDNVTKNEDSGHSITQSNETQDHHHDILQNADHHDNDDDNDNNNNEIDLVQEKDENLNNNHHHHDHIINEQEKNEQKVEIESTPNISILLSTPERERKNISEEKRRAEGDEAIFIKKDDILLRGKGKIRATTMSVQLAPIPPPLKITESPDSAKRKLISPPPPTQLLDGWNEYYDEETQSYYYLNEKTGERTKDRGVAMGTLPQIDSSNSNSNNNNTVPTKLPSSLSQTSSSAIIREYPKLKTQSNRDHKDEGGSLSPKRKKDRRKSLMISNQDSTSPPTSKKEKRKRKKDGENELLETQSHPSLPTSLQNEINKFKLHEYAVKYFQEHRKGIFRRLVPIKEMLSWSKEVIPTSLTRLPSESLSREAVKVFKQIQIYMGDKTEKGNAILVAQEIVGKGINVPELRDEIYCQLCKQTSFNPDPMSNKRGWELMILSIIYFPPTRDLEVWLFEYLEEHLKIENEEKIYAIYCIKKLHLICKTGPRGRLPTTREIERHIIAPFSVSIFGVSLDEVMELQAKKYPDYELPVVVVKLLEAVIRLNGLTSEGIFRVPGDTEQVYSLRTQLDNGNYEVGPEINDPNTPASLIKLWMRELSEPLVPADLYQECIDCQSDEECLAVLDKLPKVNRLVTMHVIEFLQKVSQEEQLNKMSVNNLAMVFAPNFLRCPTEDSKIIFENTKFEQNWVRSLIINLKFGNEKMVLE